MLRLLLCTLLAVNAFSVDRCASLTQEVRKAHWSVFGVDYPYQYGVAQLKQESGCRDIISNDGVGSEGMAQITYRWWQDVLKKEGILEIRSVSNHLRAQAILMRENYNPKYPLWVAYQRYNGGAHVLKEIERAGVVDWEKAKAQCRRGQSCFTLKSGKRVCRSNCYINYEYSQNIFKYGKEYGNVGDNHRFVFW